MRGISIPTLVNAHACGGLYGGEVSNETEGNSTSTSCFIEKSIVAGERIEVGAPTVAAARHATAMAPLLDESVSCEGLSWFDT